MDKRTMANDAYKSGLEMINQRESDFQEKIALRSKWEREEKDIQYCINNDIHGPKVELYYIDGTILMVRSHKDATNWLDKSWVATEIEKEIREEWDMLDF